MCASTMLARAPPLRPASAIASEALSAPPEQATKVRRAASRTAGPPVRRRHAATTARAAGSERVAKVGRAGVTIR